MHIMQEINMLYSAILPDSIFSRENEGSTFGFNEREHFTHHWGIRHLFEDIPIVSKGISDKDVMVM
jgi:hypothetical protein